MNSFESASERLVDLFTVLRADPFILDACLYLCLERLAGAINAQATTRRTWEQADPARVEEAEQEHRRAWRFTIEKLYEAVMAAEFAGQASTDHRSDHEDEQLN